MNVRVLVIDDEAKQKIKRVIDYALEREHWYRPSPGMRPPGDDVRFVVHLDTFRCVFTITQFPHGLYRHLSISVPSAKMPNPVAAFMIASEFGFTGWDEVSVSLPDGWIARISKPEHCIVLAQRYERPQ